MYNRVSASIQKKGDGELERNTIMFNAADRGELRTTEDILKTVYDALDEKGYNAIDQMVGYILSGENPALFLCFRIRKGEWKMRKIALDVGDKTIGVAVSDELLLTAQGVTTIERVGIRKDCGKVMDLIRQYECDTVVIGLPLRLDGSNSPQTEKVYEFKTMLENKMKSSGMAHIAIVFQDERLTTVMAEKVLIEADVRRKKRKEVIDKQAAVLILQSYLERGVF